MHSIDLVVEVRENLASQEKLLGMRINDVPELAPFIGLAGVCCIYLFLFLVW